MKSVLSTSEFTQHPALAVCQLVHSRAALYTWAPSFFCCFHRTVISYALIFAFRSFWTLQLQ